MNDYREHQIKLRDAMTRLLDNEDFQLIFEETFIKAFAVTTAYNFSLFDQEQRRNSVENLAARSVFTRFVEDIVRDGHQAEESLKEDADVEEEDGEENF